MSRRETKRKLGGKTVYSGVVFDIIRVHDSSSDKELEFALADDSVRAYPVDRDGNLWLASEQRGGFGSEPLIRAASGRVKKTEDVATAALREAYEELGVEGGSATVFHVSTTNLKLLNSVTHVLIENWTAGRQHLKASERIEPFLIPLRDVPDLVWSGRIVEDPVALALLMLHRNLIGTRREL
jgi:8-oxo-dGTP pyrophosphatase MutT (NUDIX family)